MKWDETRDTGLICLTSLLFNCLNSPYWSHLSTTQIYYLFKVISPIQSLPVSHVNHLLVSSFHASLICLTCSHLSHLSTQPSLCVFVEGDSVNILKWASVNLISNCRSYYKERFYEGMLCAGMCTSYLTCLTSPVEPNSSHLENPSPPVPFVCTSPVHTCLLCVRWSRGKCGLLPGWLRRSISV